MYILKATEELIEEKLVMLRGQVIIGLDNLMEIRLHELENDVDVSELSPRRRQQDVFDLDDVRVAEEPEELDLAEDAGGVGDVLEDVVDLLDGDFLSRVCVVGRAYDSVAPFADDFLDPVPCAFAVLREEV